MTHCNHCILAPRNLEKHMITIHHLGVSQSDRVVWLMEELNLPYELKWYDRGADFLAPAEYRALHPVGTAPIIVDGDLVMAESTAIVEYISQRHGGGRLSVPVSDPNYPHYLFWMQFNNNLQSVLFIKLAFQSTGTTPGADNPMMATTQRREDGIYRALEQRLGESDYLGGREFQLRGYHVDVQSHLAGHAGCADHRRQPAQYQSLCGARHGKAGLSEGDVHSRARGDQARCLTHSLRHRWLLAVCCVRAPRFTHSPTAGNVTGQFCRM